MSTHTTAAALRADYLDRLDVALGELPHGLAGDLRAGIAEELSGLDGTELAARIGALGAPQDVARAALEAHRITPLPEATAELAEVRPLAATRGYAIGAAVTLGLGGIVIPGIGWIVGCVLVATSALWSAREKLWGILFMPAALAISWAIYLIAAAIQRGGSSAPQDAGSPLAGGAGLAANPLLPAAYDAVWASAAFALLVLAPLAALWLVLRLRGRRSPDNAPLA